MKNKKSKLSKYLAILTFLSILTGNFDIFGQSYINLLEVNYKLSPSNQYDSINNKVDAENIYTSILLPLVRKNGDAWLPGISANRMQLSSDLDNPKYQSTFYFVRFEAGYQKKWGDSLSMIAILMPKIASDMKDLDNRSYQLGGVVLFNKVLSDKFSFKYGFYLNAEYFGIFSTPLIGFDWKIADKLRMFGFLPAIMTVEYSPFNRYRTGLKFFSTSRSYRITEDTVNIGAENTRNNYVHYLTNELNWFHDIYLTKSVVFRGQIGFSAFRYYRMFDEEDQFDFAISAFGFGGDRQPIFDGIFNKFGDGLLYQAAIIYRFDLEKK